MKAFAQNRNKKSGFTLVEIMIVIAVIAILSAIAIPGIINWLPNYRLKKAASDLYSNLQLAKLTAIRNNAQCAVVFRTGTTPGQYFVCTDPGANGIWDGPTLMGGDDTFLKMVDLASYGSSIDFGFANATDDIQGGGAPPTASVTYGNPDPPPAPPCAVFTPRGMSDIAAQGGVTEGYAYLENHSGEPANQRIAMGVGGPNTGVIRMMKWYGPSANWD